MHILLKAPQEKYFVAAKVVSNRNKAIEELSPYTKEFFRIILSKKVNFQKPTRRTYFRAYDTSNNRMGSWLVNSWKLMLKQLKLILLDFRQVPKFVAKETSTFENPISTHSCRCFYRVTS